MENRPAIVVVTPSSMRPDITRDRALVHHIVPILRSNIVRKAEAEERDDSVGCLSMQGAVACPLAKLLRDATGILVIIIGCLLQKVRTIAAGDVFSRSDRLALLIFLRAQYCSCMSADLENFETLHMLDDEDFEIEHIAIEAMIRAP